VCLLLVALCLYNPFQAAAPSSDSLNIRHSASNRATVGASELQHFSPTDVRKVFSVSLAVLFGWFELPVSLPLNSAVDVCDAHQPYSCQFLSSDFWFRPPPAI
jgi:hypothetical protein